MKRGLNKKTAWFLTVVMVLSLIMVPANQVKAADDIDLAIVDASGKSQADANNNIDINITAPNGYSTLQALVDAGYTKLQVAYSVSAYTAAASGTPGVQAYYAYGDSWKYVTGGWTNLSSGKSGTVTFDMSATTGLDSELKRFGLQIANVTDATYTITSAKLIGGASSGESSGGNSTDLGTTRDYSSGVNVTVVNQGTPSNDWSGFEMTMTNNTGSTICDWIVVLEVPSGTQSAFKCWNATFVADGNTIYLYPMKNGVNAVVSQGELTANNPGFGFSATYVDASSIKVKSVYFNKGTSSQYDYSSGDTNDETGGTGGNGGNSVTDTSTNKDLNVEYNYAKALQESLYFYDANMCGNLEGTCALSWRGNCHTYDADVTYQKNGKTYKVDASGGFHDAGDHVKFGLPQGYAATMLGMSYYQFKDAFVDLEQTAHLKKITDYFCDYFRRCTVYESGKVIAFCYQVGEGGSDHAVWCAPEGQQINRPAYFADASNPATDQVSVAIAALALNYKNFGNEEDLKVAKDLYTFMVSNSDACATEGASTFYASSSYGDDKALAASALEIATGDSSYHSVYNTYKDSSDNGVNQYWVLDWANTGALAAMLQKDTAKLESIANVCKAKPTIDGVFNCVSDWGSCRYSAAEQFVGLVHDKLANKSTFATWATAQMNYMLGDNPNKRCYIVGYNENSSKYPHHRAASRSNDAAVTMENHYTLLGALVGGPGSNGTYKDDQGDYFCNEVALDYNAGLVGAAAGLYLLHKDADTVYLSYAKKNTDNYSTNVATADELKEVGVTTYYGSGSADEEEPEQPEEPTPTADLSVSKDALECSNLVYGFAEGSSASLTISNDGDAATTSYSVTMQKGTVFEMTDGSLDKLSPGDRDEIKLTVKGKLGAGTYQDTLVITYNGNKKITIPVSVAVSKKTITVTAENKVKAYGDENPKLTISNDYETSLVSGDVLMYTLSTTAAKNSDAGTYPIQLVVAEHPNYEVVTKNAILTVNKKVVSSLQFPIASTITLEQTLTDSDLSGGSTEYGSFTWKNPDADLMKGTNDYDVVLTLNQNAIKNYDFSDVEGYDASSGTITQSVSVNVLRADLPAITFPTAKSITYGQTLNDAILTGGTTQYGTFAWENPNYTPTATDVENGSLQAYVIFTWNEASMNQYMPEEDEIRQLVSVRVNKQENANYADTPVLVNRTANGIQVAEVPGIEYSLDEMSWQTSGTFTDLTPFTSYNVYAREAETATHYPGEICMTPLNVYTLVTDPYTIDVTKFAGNEADAYVDALRVNANEEPTVAYADDTLTLKDQDATYTLTGKNENLIVQVGAENITINVKGETTLKAIVSDCEGALVLTGEGTLKVEYIDVKNELIIRDTTVIADARQSEHPAIQAGKITIENSTVEATSKTGSAIASDDITLIGKNQVTTLGKEEDLYASVPKDENGAVAKILVNRIELDVKEFTLEVSEEKILQETVYPSNADNKAVSWNSSNPAVVTVTDGKVKAIAQGTAVVTVAAKDGSGVKTNCKVTVVASESEEAVVYADAIKITGTTKKVAPGKKVKLKAIVYPENAVNQQVKWKVSNKKYATVSSTGVVKTKKAGRGKKVIVTAYLADNTNIKATYKISIMKNAVKKIKLSAKSTTLKKGKSVEVKAKFTPAKGISKELTWTSSNKKVAVVNSKGKVTAKKKGTAKITAKAKDGTGKKATIRIRVK